MLEGFKTKEKVRDDWYPFYNAGLSDFSTGAERIVYALFNGKGIGQPNSAPVGADLFFEVHDAFIHIDTKIVQTEHISYFTKSIFIGKNQNSYSSEIYKIKPRERYDPPRIYKPALPYYYNEGKDNEKVCLTYFGTILYERTNLVILNINIISMPNG